MINKLNLLSLALLFCLPPLSMAQTLQADTVNSSIIFKINHNQGYTTGYFKDFAASLEVSDDQSTIKKADAIIKINSIDTNSAVRDEGLISAMFFDGEKFPEAKFESTQIEGDQMSGLLTIKGITKPITMTATLSKDSGKLVLTARGTFNRNDYGIDYNRELAPHQKAIGDMVDLTVELHGNP